MLQNSIQTWANNDGKCQKGNSIVCLSLHGALVQADMYFKNPMEKKNLHSDHSVLIYTPTHFPMGFSTNSNTELFWNWPYNHRNPTTKPWINKVLKPNRVWTWELISECPRLQTAQLLHLGKRQLQCKEQNFPVATGVGWGVCVLLPCRLQ